MAGEEALPQFVAFKANYNNKYLRYMSEGELRGSLHFSGDQVVNPFSKCEIVKAKIDRKLVHIKSCFNNKYWSAFSERFMWITPLADEPEEDRSKKSCTLFEPLYDDDLKAYRFRHVNLGLYLIARTSPVVDRDMLFLDSDEPDEGHYDLFTLTDIKSLLVLPKYIAFKGDNGCYLRAAMQEGHEYLEFSGTDISDSKAGFKVVMNDDGSVRIKSSFFDKFWRLSPNWIWADTTDESSLEDQDTWFWPTNALEEKKMVVGLKNLGNNLFCKRLTTEGKTDCLNAAEPNITNEAKLQVEELIISREITDINFRTLESKIYNETIKTKDYINIENNTSEVIEKEITMGFKETVSRTFSSTVSLKLGAKTTIEAKVVPFIVDSEIELSAEFTGSLTWGEAKTSEEERKYTTKIKVGPNKKVKATLVVTKGFSNVPFSYTQRDTLLNGKVKTTELDDGMFIGINCYNMHDRVKEV